MYFFTNIVVDRGPLKIYSQTIYLVVRRCKAPSFTSESLLHGVLINIPWDSKDNGSRVTLNTIAGIKGRRVTYEDKNCKKIGSVYLSLDITSGFPV